MSQSQSLLFSQSTATMVEVRSAVLRTTWAVPADLIQLPSSSIVMLVTMATLNRKDGTTLPLPTYIDIALDTTAAANIQLMANTVTSTHSTTQAADATTSTATHTSTTTATDTTAASPTTTTTATVDGADSTTSITTASQSQLVEQEHDTIIRHSICHSVVKYWLYLRMFWHCRRSGDDLVVKKKMAAIERIPDSGKGVLQRWTRVKKGLALMAILLNNRQTLSELLECRAHSLFDNLIYLHVRHQQQPMIAHIVQQVKAEQTADVTTTWMKNVCQTREMSDLNNSTDTSLLHEDRSGEQVKQEESEEAEEDMVEEKGEKDDDGDDDEDDEQHPSQPQRVEQQVEQLADNSERMRSTRSRTASRAALTHVSSPPSTTAAAAPVKRKLAAQTRKSPVKRVTRASTAKEESKEGEAREGSDKQRSTSPLSVSATPSSSTSSAVPPLPLPLPLPLSPSLTPSPSAPILPLPQPSLAEQLRVALAELHSMPVLTYYSRLLLDYPNQLLVAAPLAYTDHDMYGEMLRHRMEDQCHTPVLLYERDYLLHHSHGLARLPALALSPSTQMEQRDTADAEPALSIPVEQLDTDTRQPTRVWLFFPDTATDSQEDDDDSNSRRALSFYQQYYPRIAAHSSTVTEQQMWDAGEGQLKSLPARLLLEAGVHMLLAVQRAGETVTMGGSSPSRYDSPCAHMVHTLPSPIVLSVAGSYCSSQHLLDHIEHRWERPSGDNILVDSQTEAVPIDYPADVFPATFPSPAPLHKPTADWLRTRHQSMCEDRERQYQARASELDCPDQMLYLLNQELDWSMCQRSTAPPAGLISSLSRLLYRAPPNGRARLMALLTKCIALSTTMAGLQPFRSCSLSLGCAVGTTSVLPRWSVDESVAVFRFSPTAHRRPLLFVRTIDAEVLASQRELACSQLSTWQSGELYRYTVTRPTVPPHSAAGVSTTRQLPLPVRSKLPQPISAHHLSPVHSSYLQHVCAEDQQTRQQTVAELQRCVHAELVGGGALRWCELPTDGVHYPSFHALISSAAALSSSVNSAALTDMHNQPQRLGFWHHILPVDQSASMLTHSSESNDRSGIEHNEGV